MELNHIDKDNKPTMVDIGDKEITSRSATAKTQMYLPDIVAEKIDSNGTLNLKKGPVFNTAIIAGTMAVKKTSDLIPFCHPLMIDSIKIGIEHTSKNKIDITCTVNMQGKTGVEMEALTGASITALTIYDMCKALSHEIRIEKTYLCNKSGGKRTIKDSREIK